MTDIAITITPDASGTITIGGATAPVTGKTIEQTREEAMQQAVTHARQTGEPAEVTADDPTGTFYLTVTPDGGILNRPAPTDPGTAGWEQEPALTGHDDPGAPQVAFDEQGRDRRPSAPQRREPIPHNVEDLNVPPASQPAPADPEPAPAAPLDEAANVPALSELVGAGGIEVTTDLSTTPDPLETDPRWIKISQQPAEDGWRGTLNGWGLKITPTEDELAQRREALRQEITREEQERLEAEQHAQEEAVQESRRAAREREAAAKDRTERALIQTSFEEPKNVLIANDKGGQGKTSACYCIGATAGRIRGGDVVSWDANETRGNLGFRAKKAPTARSVVDLLEQAAEDFTTVEGSKRSTLARFTRSQGDNLFAVLASDESRDRQDLVDAEAFEKVHEILGRFYSLILIDTGNNHRVSHFTAALAATDQLVIPVSAGADGAYAAETMMDTFESLGYGDLVKNAVVLLNDSATRRGDATGIATKFEQRVRAIIPIPFDPALDSGEEIDFDALQPATRAAYQEATATIAQGLADTKENQA